ncbi:MAG: aspartate-semialdehyde dehydrogenase [Gammaproteobacteria bacterium]|nr:aspartate-semialdehyde dehydrogenase [Gammaproteobacteria bacterium]
MSEQFNIAVVGAHTLVGKALIELIEQREFPVDCLYPLAADASIADAGMYKNKPLKIKELNDFDWSQVHLAFFCEDQESTLKFATIAAESGVAVIDTTSSFIDRQDIPMVIPHLNGSAIADFRNSNIISSPSSASIQLWTVLKPIADQVAITRINLTNHHSVSSAGESGIKELAKQCSKLLNGMQIEDNPYSAQLAFNILPTVGQLGDDGISTDERLINNEAAKFLGDDSGFINTVSVMTPVFYGLAQSINIETISPIDPEEVAQWLTQCDQIEYDPTHVPTQVGDASGTDMVHVGRLRSDLSHPNGLNVWTVADNTRAGTALNSLKIAELLIRDYY